jgi:hypothetical protein
MNRERVDVVTAIVQDFQIDNLGSCMEGQELLSQRDKPGKSLIVMSVRLRTDVPNILTVS